VDREATAEVKAVLGMGNYFGSSPTLEGAAGQQQWLLPDAAWLGGEEDQQAVYQQSWVFVPMGDFADCSALQGADWSDQGAWPSVPQASSMDAGASATSSSGTRRKGGDDTSAWLAGGETRTTVMLRNMPTSLTRNVLLEMLTKLGFAGCFDMVYLPVDFSTGAGLGYAFVNMVSSNAVPPLWEAFDNFSAWGIETDKVCAVSWAEPNQGLSAHVERYRNSPVMHPAVPDEWKPALFSDGLRVEFPAPTKKIKAPKVRGKKSEPVA